MLQNMQCTDMLRGTSFVYVDVVWCVNILKQVFLTNPFPPALALDTWGTRAYGFSPCS